MGNPGFIYERTTVDLGARGVTNAAPGRAFEGTRVFAGTSQTILTRLYDKLMIEKVFNEARDPDLFRQLNSFWSYAAAGRPFAFALDLAKTGNSVLLFDPGFGNVAQNGDFEAWIPGAAAPDRWTLTQVGSTTFSRETNREDVYDGSVSLRWNMVAGAQSTAMIQSTTTIFQFNPFTVSFRYRANALAQFQFAIKDVVGNLWWTGAAWSAVQTWLVTTPPTTMGWTLYSTTPAGGPNNDTPIQVWFRASGTPTQSWLDDVRIVQGVGLATVRDGGFAVGDQVKLMSVTTLREENVKINTVSTAPDGSQQINFTTTPQERYDVRDWIRHADFYPYMVADQKEAAIVEEPGGIYHLRLQCREAATGRP